MIRSPLAALVILTLVNMFNYIDRYVVPVLREVVAASPVAAARPARKRAKR